MRRRPQNISALARPWFIHPLIVYAAPWLAVAYLYVLGWSEVLRYDTRQALEASLLVIAPILVSWLYWEILLHATTRKSRPADTLDIRWMQRCTHYLIAVWIPLTLLEVFVSGGVPLLWLLTDSTRTYFDFGIQSFHGFTLSILLAATTMSMVLGLLTRKRRYFLLPLFTILWGVATVSRNTMFVTVVQLVLVYVQYRSVRMSSFIALAVIAAALSLLVFGVLGDLRTPTFMEIAGITPEYPDWLPSGAIWGYIYLTSPLNNLMYSMEQLPPGGYWYLPVTVAQLFPSIVRFELVPEAEVQGVLVADSFNVSTAYVGPYMDLGYVGMCIFAWITMGLVVAAWKARTVLGSLAYALFAQCALFSIFFNHFFALAISMQLLWFALAATVQRRSRPAGSHQPAPGSNETSESRGEAPIPLSGNERLGATTPS